MVFLTFVIKKLKNNTFCNGFHDIVNEKTIKPYVLQWFSWFFDPMGVLDMSNFEKSHRVNKCLMLK